MFNINLYLFIVYAIKCIWTSFSCVRSNLNFCHEFVSVRSPSFAFPLCVAVHLHTYNADKGKKRNLD